MSIVYNNKFVKVYKENFFYKKKKVKNFHRVFLNNAVMAIVINPNKEILLTSHRLIKHKKRIKNRSQK